MFESLRDKECSLNVAVEIVVRLLRRKHVVLAGLTTEEVPNSEEMWDMLQAVWEVPGVKLVQDLSIDQGVQVFLCWE